MRCSAASPPKTRRTIHPGLRPPVAYRSAAGFGIRLDAGTAYGGAVITPYYDSLLVKVTAWAPNAGGNDPAHGPRAARIPHPRRAHRTCRSSKTSSTIRSFSRREYTTTLHRHHARTVRLPQATRPRQQLLGFIGDVVVNGNPEMKGAPARPSRGHSPEHRTVEQGRAAARHERQLEGARRGGVRAMDARREARAADRHHDARRPPVAARHPHAQPRHARRSRRATRACCRSCSRSNAGAARRSTSRCASLSEDPWERLAALRERVPNILLQMLLRGQRRGLYELCGQRRAVLRQAARPRAASICSACSTR